MNITEGSRSLIVKNTDKTGGALFERDVDVFVRDSFEHAKQNNGILLSDYADEQLFVLLRPTYTGSIILARLAVADGKQDLFKVVFCDTKKPIKEQPYLMEFIHHYPNFDRRFNDLIAISKIGWDKFGIQSEILPDELPEEIVIAYLDDAYSRYIDRSYHPLAFALSDDGWKKQIATLILDGYKSEYADNLILGFTSDHFIFDANLTNINRETLYLIYSPTEAVLSGCTYRRAHIDFPQYERELRESMTELNGIEKNTHLDYPLLRKWAYLENEELVKLSYQILSEKWTLANERTDSATEAKAIGKYIENTFVRLLWEKKILLFNARKERVDELGAAQIAVFNTGLVNRTYQPIFALFRKNDREDPIWKLDSFDVIGRGAMNGVSVIPERARYFSSMHDMFYDMDVLNARSPEINIDHVLVDNIERMPVRVQQFYLGSQYDDYKNSGDYNQREIRENRPTNSKNNLAMLFKNALEKSIRMAEWSYKTGIPMYYIPEGEMTILLPLAIESELDMLQNPEQSMTQLNFDLSLAMKYSTEGDAPKYIAKTVLTLDMAYRDARLVARPNSDWLSANIVKTQSE